MKQFDYDCIYAFYQQVIKKHTSLQEDKQLDFLLQMYCRGSIDMTVDWVKKNMQMPIDQIVQLLIEAIPQRLVPYLETLNKK